MIRIFSHYVSKMAFMLLILEALVLLIASGLASALWFGRAGESLADLHLSGHAVVFALLTIFSMSALGMYHPSSRTDIKTSAQRLMPSFALGFGLLSVVLTLRPEMDLGLKLSMAIFGFGAAGVLLARVVVFKSAGSPFLKSRLIFVGSGALAGECITLAGSKTGFHRFRIIGCVPLDDEASTVAPASLLTGGDTLLALAHRHEANEIVVTVANRRSSAFPIRQLLDCALGGVKVIDSATFFEREACQIRVDSLHPSYLIFGGGFDQGVLRATSKRAVDLFASTLLALLTLPIMLATALSILFEDGGPVFYQQERVGKDGRRFKVLKFRSMRLDAEKAGTPTWATVNDPRITRVGTFIRKLRIDELPQMFNVFKGDMSFVGPRPERAYFVDQLAAEIPYYTVRHGIKPGITGLAQVRYQYGASVEDAIQKLQYDLYYVKNNSLFLDLLIMIDTVQVVLFGKGSR